MDHVFLETIRPRKMNYPTPEDLRKFYLQNKWTTKTLDYKHLQNNDNFKPFILCLGENKVSHLFTMYLGTWFYLIIHEHIKKNIIFAINTPQND